MWHCKPPRGGEHQPLIIIEACLSKHGDEHLMQKSLRGVGVLQVVQDTRSPTDRVVNAAHDVVHVTPGHTITTSVPVDETKCRGQITVQSEEKDVDALFC